MNSCGGREKMLDVFLIRTEMQIPSTMGLSLYTHPRDCLDLRVWRCQALWGCTGGLQNYHSCYGREVLLFVYLCNVCVCERVRAPATMYMEVRGQCQESVLAFYLTEVAVLILLVLWVPGWLPMSFRMMLLPQPPSCCKCDRVVGAFHSTGLICEFPESVVWVASSSADPHP